MIHNKPSGSRQARCFIVSGRVQGVWFRDSTRRVAGDLGITGHAINLENGNVEVVAYGSQAALQRLAAWLHEGPPMSSVANVEESVVPWQQLSGFRVG